MPDIDMEPVYAEAEDAYDTFVEGSHYSSNGIRAAVDAAQPLIEAAVKEQIAVEMVPVLATDQAHLVVPNHGTLPWFDAYTNVGGRILTQIGCTDEQRQAFAVAWEDRCWPILATLVAECAAMRGVYQAADRLVGDWQAGRVTHGGELSDAVVMARLHVTSVEPEHR